jgi:hypothetical protein
VGEENASHAVRSVFLVLEADPKVLAPYPAVVGSPEMAEIGATAVLFMKSPVGKEHREGAYCVLEARRG